MRCLALSLSLLLLAGCCASRPAEQATQPQRAYEDAPAASLVFDPPVLASLPPVDLHRELRQPSAVLAYESLTATYFYIRTDDWQITDLPWVCSTRRAIMETVGVTYR